MEHRLFWRSAVDEDRLWASSRFDFIKAPRPADLWRKVAVMGDPFLNYFALFLLVFVVVVLFYGIIAIHDIPAKIAESRHHPHQDAIHAAGWVSLFTLHAIWPFLWIWAMLYRPDRGWGFAEGQHDHGGVINSQLGALQDLERRVSALEHRTDHGVH